MTSGEKIPVRIEITFLVTALEGNRKMMAAVTVQLLRLIPEILAEQALVPVEQLEVESGASVNHQPSQHDLDFSIKIWLGDNHPMRQDPIGLTQVIRQRLAGAYRRQELPYSVGFAEIRINPDD